MRESMNKSKRMVEKPEFMDRIKELTKGLEDNASREPDKVMCLAQAIRLETRRFIEAYDKYHEWKCKNLIEGGK